MHAVTITPTEALGLGSYEAQGITQLEIKDVERLLSASRPTVQKLIDSKQIPSFKIGPVTKIPIAGFKKFIGQQMAK